MNEQTFRCLWVTAGDTNQRAHAEVSQQPVSSLPAGDVLIRVQYSSLNYKDALGATGHPGVVRKFPHIPGIDAAGVVQQSTDPRYSPGMEVLVTGFQLGAPAWGGYSELIRVPAEWVVPLPAGLSPRDAMLYGTAGFTAALSIEALQQHAIHPDSGPVIVTGASGGVGSMAVGILARLGYQVTAVTGKPAQHDYLRQLGAAEVVGREAVADDSGRPLLNARWAGVVDTVGGEPLAILLRSTQTHGCVTACGMVAGAEFSTSVYPFILRGVTLCGIDSATYASHRRPQLWQLLADAWRPAELQRMHTATVSLEELMPQVERILAADMTGRVVVQVAN